MSPRNVMESFFLIVPSSSAWLSIGSSAPVREMGGLVSEHQVEVTCEEGRFAVTWRLDETMDRLIVLVVVTEPLADDAAFKAALLLVELFNRYSPSCAWFVDEADRVIARSSACYRHLEFGSRFVTNVTEEAIMDVRAHGGLLLQVLAGELSVDEALAVLPLPI